jgi:proline racemase
VFQLNAAVNGNGGGVSPGGGSMGGNVLWASAMDAGRIIASRTPRSQVGIRAPIRLSSRVGRWQGIIVDERAVRAPPFPPTRSPPSSQVATGTALAGAMARVLACRHVSGMRADRLLTSVEFHTAGIGMRLITSGVPRLPGASIADKRAYFQQHLDHLRRGLCLPPRGHPGLLIAVLVDPVTPGADFGLLFMYPGGYYVSCGEATIGAATIAVSTGLVPAAAPDTRVLIDTEAGPVETIAHCEGDRVRAVTLRWTPAFVLRPAETVKLEGFGDVPLDLAVGAGNVFAIVEAARVGLAIRRDLAGEIARRGMAARAAVNEQLRVEAPGSGVVPIENVILHEPLAAGVSRNALVWGPGQVDVAPCGSGTCARLALFHHRGQLAVGGTCVSEGLSGLSFTGRIAGETVVAGHRAILPEITGSAHVTGTSQLTFDPDDPLRDGLPP